MSIEKLPVKLLCDKSKENSEESLEIDEGMAPVKKFVNSHKIFNSVRFPSSCEISPANYTSTYINMHKHFYHSDLKTEKKMNLLLDESHNNN